MPKYTLKYFDGRGRAEVSRLLFAQAGVEYEDVRYTFEEWPAVKPGTPFGKVPILEIDGKPLTQSLAIASCLAKEFGMFGNNPMEMGRIMEVMFFANDTMDTAVNVMFEKDEAKKAEMMKKNLEEEMPRLFGALTKLLGSSKFFVGSAVTVADLLVFAVLDGFLQNEDFAKLLQKYPTLIAHKEKIAQLPKIAAYLSKRPKTKMNMPKYTLKYFDVRGRAEISRLLFAQAGVEFEDVRYTFEQWAAVKPGAPFGKLPILEIDGKPLTQSLAIASYLAKEFGMFANNSMEMGRIMEVMFIGNDINETAWKVVFEKDEAKKAEIMKTNLEEEMPRLFGALTKLLGSNTFFVGSAVTVADLLVFSVIDGFLQNEDFAKLLQKFPTLTTHKDKIAQLPNIAAYLAKRPKTAL
ncbi:uncharacterized protein LOC141902255 [Tubulanus polymorphus]|uniref:uncharacterized protein LOC141902255 n=1 Tax=Tubulanus polymorphus TaxID=672921 RepID=UPI003DA62E3F